MAEKPKYMELELGGREFRVRPLTIAQLRQLGIGEAESLSGKNDPDPAVREAAFWDRWIDIIHLAVKDEHSDVTVETLLALPVQRSLAVIEAVNKILDFAGVERKETNPGEQ